jgi:hypothetical protein
MGKFFIDTADGGTAAAGSLRNLPVAALITFDTMTQLFRINVDPL